MTNTNLSSDKLLCTLGITKPHEIDLEAIAYYLGVTVKYRELIGCAARIVGTNTKAIITVDNKCSLGRARFSIGHELGHWARDKGKTYLCKSGDLSADWDQKAVESLANMYSANLLMPKIMFKPKIEGRDINYETVGDLVEEFKVSRPAAALRLVGLASQPCMLVCHKQGEQRYAWFKRAPCLPEEIWPCAELSHETAAFEVLYSNNNQARPVTSNSALWINHRSSNKYTVVEDSIKTEENKILTLIWWKDKSQLASMI